MRFSLTSLIRLIALGALTMTTAAIGVSRLRPLPPAALVRAEAPPRYLGVNGSSFEPVASGSFLLDTQAGTLTPLGRIEGHLIEYASCSPWTDGQRRPEIVGRAVSHGERDSQAGPRGPALARVVSPFLSVRIGKESHPIMTGRPCWLPGSSSRIVFPAGDGELYLEDLPPSDRAGAGAEPLPPRSLTWSCPAPGNGAIMLNDPIVPTAEPLRSWVFLSISFCHDIRHKKTGTSEIWWLKLDPDRASIVAAGRVATPACPREEQRLPNVGNAPDGRPVLAYLARTPTDSEWRLKLAPLGFDPATGAPVATRAAVDLGGGFSTTPPAISPDGRWIFALPRLQPDSRVVKRVSLLDALARRPDDDRRVSQGVGEHE